MITSHRLFDFKNFADDRLREISPDVRLQR